MHLSSAAHSRRRRLVALLLGAVLAGHAGVASGEQAVVINGLPRGGCGPSNVEGWEFKTTAAITVSGLGMYAELLLPALAGSEPPVELPARVIFNDTPVGLYDASCTLLAQATIPAGTTAALIGFHRYVSISPVELPPDKTYRLAAVVRCEDRDPEVSPGEYTLHPALTAPVGYREAFGQMLSCPNQMSSNLAFAPNMLIGPPCGNGLLETGEECDDGNLADGDCCSPTCTIQNEGAECTDDGGICTEDVCAAGICTHPPGNAGAMCRNAAFDCDAVELCDGILPFCPEDELAADDTPCTDDGFFCTGEELCSNGACESRGDPCDDDAICDEDANACFTPVPTATNTPLPTATNTLLPTATATSTITATAPATATRSHTAVAGSPTATPPTVATATQPIGATATATTPPPATATATLPAATESPGATSTPTPPSSGCLGDCGGDGSVGIGELITAVGIALGVQPIDACRAVDASGNGAVEINELIAAVANALNGC